MDFSSIREEIGELGQKTAGQIFETERLMRLLHEDVVERIPKTGRG
jgi:hypothetical protein